MHRIPANILVRHTFGEHKDVIRPESNGCLGSWNGGSFELEVAPINGIEVIQVDENDNISFPPSTLQGRRQVFTIPIPLIWSQEEGLLTTRYPSNSVRLQESKTPRIWEISIETRGDTGFFLTIKRIG